MACAGSTFLFHNVVAAAAFTFLLLSFAKLFELSAHDCFPHYLKCKKKPYHDLCYAFNYCAEVKIFHAVIYPKSVTL